MNVLPSVPPDAGAPLFGAIDLGTHTCRLLIGKPVDVEKRATFSSVSSFSRVIRLGEGLSKNKPLLTRSAIHRGLAALEECGRRLAMHKVFQIRCVGTEACRQAFNIQGFRSLVKQRTGLMLEVISSQEESRLAVTGCWDLLDPQVPYAVVFDIGGGSTEVVLVNTRDLWNLQIIDSLSLPYGILSLRDPLVNNDGKKRISEVVAKKVAAFAERNNLYALVDAQSVQMIGASGTVTTFAALLMDLPRFDREKVNGFRLPRQELSRLMENLWAMDRAHRLAHPCIGPNRADFVMGGVAIFQGLFNVLAVNHTVVANRGVREGLLYAMLRQTDCEARCPSVAL
jgi:exopolyphosphatase/guanosine-5'-triphosphate,3'-diphosphate pyrophosphatase